MINMPDWVTTKFGVPSGRFNSGSGKWETVKEKDSWELKFDFKSGDGSYATNPIAGESDPYYLWFYVGDWDQGKIMVFEKQHK